MAPPVIATLDDPDGGETAVTWQWYRGGSATTGVSDLVVLTAANDNCTAADADSPNVATPDSPCIINGQTSAPLHAG